MLSRRSVALGITPTWIRLESLSDEVVQNLLSFRSTHSHASPPPALRPAAGRCIVVSVLFLTVSGSQGSPPPLGPGARPCGAESIYTPLPRPAQGPRGASTDPTHTGPAGTRVGACQLGSHTTYALALWTVYPVPVDVKRGLGPSSSARNEATLWDLPTTGGALAPRSHAMGAQAPGRREPCWRRAERFGTIASRCWRRCRSRSAAGRRAPRSWALPRRRA